MLDSIFNLFTIKNGSEWYLLYIAIFVFLLYELIWHTPRLFLLFGIQICFMGVMFLPLFFFAPYFHDWLMSLGIISYRWEYHDSRLITYGVFYISFFIILILGFAYTAIKRLSKVDDSFFQLQQRKNPNPIHYNKLDRQLIVRYREHTFEEFKGLMNVNDFKKVIDTISDERARRMAMAWIVSGLPYDRAVHIANMDKDTQFALYRFNTYKEIEERMKITIPSYNGPLSVWSDSELQ